jgi:hypothetical protein
LEQGAFEQQKLNNYTGFSDAGINHREVRLKLLKGKYASTSRTF